MKIKKIIKGLILLLLYGGDSRDQQPRALKYVLLSAAAPAALDLFHFSRDSLSRHIVFSSLLS